MEQSISTKHDGDINPLDRDGLCLLSLDGGGVRGLSSLYILKVIMDRLNSGKKTKDRMKPCEIFDLIGGTSTGGLIAIMLGRLEMDVDECIKAYSDLTKAVFGEKLHKIPMDWKGRINARFDSTKLENAIKDVMARKGVTETELLNDGTERGCRVFVCAADRYTKKIVRLRSYNLLGRSDIPATICQAALATSAATTFFDPVLIDDRSFADGAFGANNPVNEVEGEASNIWSPDKGDLKPLVKCFISIGTGNPGVKPFEDSLLEFLRKTMADIATETENTEAEFIERWRGHFDERRYFRFNVEQGLQNIGMDEYNSKGPIKSSTEGYLSHQDRMFRVRDCVRILELKQNLALINLESAITKHNERLLVGRHTGQPSRVTYHFIPFLRSRRFIGREAILHMLKQKLFSQKESQCAAVFGLGGVGKTQVALQLAHWVKEHIPDRSIFWLPALSNASFNQACTEIARELAIPKNAEDKNARELVQRYLSSEKAGPWFLIVDNADDSDVIFGNADKPDGICDFLPESDVGVTLFTTRSRQVAVSVAGSDVIELQEMNSQEANIFLEKSLVQRDLLRDEAAKNKLLEELKYLPLAIAQAAAYLNTARVSIAKYLDLLHGTEQEMVDLMSRQFRDNTRYRGSENAVATTWLVSFDQIRKVDHIAANLLSFMSRIEPKAIPLSILPRVESEEQMVHAIGTLDGYAFVTKREDDKMLDMHSLVHLATQVWIQKSNNDMQASRDAICHIAAKFPSSDYANRILWREYLPHALRVLQGKGGSDIEEKHDLYLAVGQCLEVDGRIKEAVRCIEASYRWRKCHFVEEHPSRLVSQHELAAVYHADGQIKKAIELFEHVVTVQERTLSEEHAFRLISQNTLAVVYRVDGQIKKAVELLEHVVTVQERTLSENHLDQLISQHGLAAAYHANGQTKKAIELFEHVVTIQERTLSEEHPSQLASQHGLAAVYHASGQIKKAIELLEHVVKVRERTLSEEHPDRLVSQHELAAAYQADGQIKKAIELFEHVVTMHKRTLSEEHLDQLASQHGLAAAYHASGQIKKAVELLEHVVKVRERTLSEEHPDRLASQHALARCIKLMVNTT